MKLIFTLLLGCFCIYGMEHLGVIHVDDFKPPEDAIPKEAMVLVMAPEELEANKNNNTHEVAEAPQRFTDRIAAKNRI